MQYISQQDLYNTARGKKLYAIPYDLRPRKQFEACHVMRAWNLDILSLDIDLNKIKASKEASIEFLKQVPGFDKVQKRFEVNVYLISGKQTEVFLEDIRAIFGNSISPSRIFALDVEREDEEEDTIQISQ
ncbi:MAG: hypothetical protein EZS28_021582 [Streblomastix strix]|uniref:Rhodanese domain-containing protein n=1 Tax=Streblomastix strix TaxID=222440 RepID=A0A5J4VJY7_9EUKA|nr:MAG: hypothetical protein EZS28_021582 [Streblomastix strix]